MQDAAAGAPAAIKAAGFATNNFGFATPHDFPYTKKSAREFVVGVFGGSVGVWFCQLGMPRLTELLGQRAVLPRPDHRARCVSATRATSSRNRPCC